jgi:hypothetical protein
MQTFFQRVACVCMPLFFYVSTTLFAQRDANWVMGFDIGSSTLDSLLIWDFKNDPPAITTYKRPGLNWNAPHYQMKIAPSVISDGEGNLKYYSDGIRIMNKDHQVIQRGDSLFLFQVGNNWVNFGSNFIWNGSMFLPFPDHPDSTLFFSMKAKQAFDSTVNASYTYCLQSHYSLIDHKGNNGAGNVVDRMHTLNDTDSLACGRFKAVHHANGRDWWFIQSARSGAKWFMYLLTPDGISLHHTQEIDSAQSNTIWHQTCFSPDGNWFAAYYQLNGGCKLFTWQFDRCAGLLSSLNRIDITPKWKDGGVAFSPSSRFLYVSATDTVYQFDMQEPDLESSKIAVGVLDSVLVDFNIDPTVTQLAYLGFWFAQLAPNGKIYISTLYQTNYLNTIHNPDEKGLACNFKQRDVVFNPKVGWALPNLVHFNTGKLVGSPCDSIISTVQSVNEKPPTLEISPNPASDYVRIHYSGTGKLFGAVLEITNSVGKVVKAMAFDTGQQTINTDDLDSGVYIVTLRDVYQTSVSAKMVVFKE